MRSTDRRRLSSISLPSAILTSRTPPAAASGATAVVAYNDLVALGLESGLLELGRKCPADISIVGIDDIDLAGAVTPGLTTVRMPIARSGALAVDVLLQAIVGTVVDDITLGSQLIVRASTAVAAA
nr:substrate-binding domain-containing protein [Microbacterium sp. AK031]